MKARACGVEHRRTDRRRCARRRSKLARLSPHSPSACSRSPCRLGNAAFAWAVLLLATTAWRIRSGTRDPDDPVNASLARVQHPDGEGVDAP
jgi:hypothetical protein